MGNGHSWNNWDWKGSQLTPHYLGSLVTIESTLLTGLWKLAPLSLSFFSAKQSKSKDQ
ncbi:unnamed protein product, partial [Ilex paraguariensis]